MNYSDIRLKIKSGDLLAWSHRSWKSWNDIKIQIIRFFTQSEYSHVGIAWVIGGRVFVLEAVIPLIRIYPLSKSGEFYHIPLNCDWTDTVEEFALSHVGEEYSTLEAIKAFFGKVSHDSKWECAEYVIDVLKEAGINLGDKATPTAVVREGQLTGGSCTLVTQ